MIIGYEFKLTFDDHTEWTQLHGSGGAMGNGALHVQDEGRVEVICDALLNRARLELEREGEVRRSNDARHDEPLHIEPVAPRSIVGCRPLRSR